MGDKDKTVFISYRREVSAYHARAIFMDLRNHGFDVFMDVESIDSGTFDSIILNQIAARAHFLIILTPGTLERCNESGDWLRLEIELALKLERNIVPIMTTEFNFDNVKSHLTGKLARLARYSGVTLHHEYFDAAMARLRKRFLTKPVLASIIPTPNEDREAVRNKIEKIIEKPVPTKAQLSAEDLFIHGSMKRDLGEFKEAIADFNHAIQLNPQDVKAYYNRGLAYYHLGDNHSAIEDYKRVIKLTPHDGNPYYNRGLAYFNLGEFKRAIANFNRTIQINPKDHEAYNNRGLAYYNLGDYKLAIEDYIKAIRLKPLYDKAYYNRGLAYNKLEDYKMAIADYDLTNHLNPKDDQAYYNRGCAYDHLGNSEQAASDFQKVIEISTDQELIRRAMDNLGKLYKRSS